MRVTRKRDADAGADAHNRSPMELVSPELVLVAPSELGRLAREQLPLPWDVWPAVRPAVAIGQRRTRRLPAWAFGLFCVLDCVGPLAFVIAVAR